MSNYIHWKKNPFLFQTSLGSQFLKLSSTIVRTGVDSIFEIVLPKKKKIIYIEEILR